MVSEPGDYYIYDLEDTREWLWLTSDVAQVQGRNIRHYASYLMERVKAYRDTKLDWVRTRETRLEKLSVEKGLLRETEAVQRQLTALLKCDVRPLSFGLV